MHHDVIAGRDLFMLKQEQTDRALYALGLATGDEPRALDHLHRDTETHGEWLALQGRPHDTDPKLCPSSGSSRITIAQFSMLPTWPFDLNQTLEPAQALLRSRGRDIPIRLMRLSSWILAARPRTLSLSVAPVLVGTALAWAAERQLRWSAVPAALLSSMLVQLGTNLHNDAADARRGGDGPGRVGPPRATASGLLDGEAVSRAAYACLAAAAFVGIYLIWLGGWPIFVLGIAAILSAVAYSGGPFPVAYTPLGEVFVVAFFGLGAVGGTYWLCCGTLAPVTIEAGLAMGCPAAAVLLVNNHRDADGDGRVGRRTLAILAGPTATIWIYAALMLAPFALLVPIAEGLPRGHVWPALIAMPLAGLVIYRFAREPPGRGFNRILAQTVLVQSAFGLLLSLGLAL
jgi:1,4-dihydroxy-2-naphthoate octaprenyltransferase